MYFTDNQFWIISRRDLGDTQIWKRGIEAHCGIYAMRLCSICNLIIKTIGSWKYRFNITYFLKKHSFEKHRKTNKINSIYIYICVYKMTYGNLYSGMKSVSFCDRLDPNMDQSRQFTIYFDRCTRKQKSNTCGAIRNKPYSIYIYIYIYIFCIYIYIYMHMSVICVYCTVIT